MDVIQKVADDHETFQVFIRYGNAETVFGCDGQVDFGERVKAELVDVEAEVHSSRLSSRDVFNEFGEHRLDLGLLHTDLLRRAGERGGAVSASHHGRFGARRTGGSSRNLPGTAPPADRVPRVADHPADVAVNS